VVKVIFILGASQVRVVHQNARHTGKKVLQMLFNQTINYSPNKFDQILMLAVIVTRFLTIKARISITDSVKNVLSLTFF